MEIRMRLPCHSTEVNTEALHQMTSGFADSAPLEAMLTFQLDSLQSSRQVLASMPNPGKRHLHPARAAHGARKHGDCWQYRNPDRLRKNPHAEVHRRPSLR